MESENSAHSSEYSADDQLVIELERMARETLTKPAHRPTSARTRKRSASDGDGAEAWIGKRSRGGEILDDQAGFETLLANLFSSFVNLPADRLDSEIERGQGHICMHFQLDRSAIWQFLGSKGQSIHLTHLYHRSANDPAATRPQGTAPALWDDWNFNIPEARSGLVFMEPQKHFPWLAKQIRENRAVVLSRLDDLPPAAAHDKLFLNHYGTKSSVMIPLTEGGEVIGIMTFATFNEERQWHAPVVNRFRLIARIFAQAIARKQTDQALRDSEARLVLAAESANAGLWDVNMSNGEIWATPKTRELFGINPDAPLTLDRILNTIHPEDIPLVRKSFEQVACEDEYARTDFRVLLPGGALRWITSRGRPHAKSPGEPVRLMGVALDITERKRMEEELQTRLQEITELKKQFEQENLYLKQEFRSLSDQSELVGQSKPMQKVFQQVQQVASTDSHVLIMGETGTGKELVSRAIHAASKRKDRILVKVNCATLPSTLIESELFGREKGAYTGALTRQIGRFEMADKGTIFLDEIGELSMDLQSKLLRVLQEQEFERLGGTKTIHVDVRIIAATNRNLVEAVQKGDFRKDLYYRLSVFPIEVPPLRAHAEDIPLLVWAFIDQFSQRMGKTIKSVSQKTMDQLMRYRWPGNIRELRNAIERAMIISSGDRLEVQLPDDSRVSDSPILNFMEAEQQIITDALQRANGHIKGPQGAAALLGLKPSTLYTKMQKLGIHNSRL